MTDDFRPRTYPAVLLMVVITVAAFVPAALFPRERLHFAGMLGGWLFAGLGTVVWWILLSRVKGLMRWLPPLMYFGAIGTAIAEYPEAMMLLHIIFCVVTATSLWLLSTIFTSRLGWSATRASVLGSQALAILLIVGVRIDGASADLMPELSWRWQKTPEQLAMEQRGSATNITIAPLVITSADWAQFRGPNQDSKIVGATIRTDWDKTPPKELWRKRVGPGWGTFSAVGDFLFTQEQRGGNEAIVCLKAATGEEAWSYETPSRFEEAISGVGPRGTPTVVDGSVFAFGALGKLTRLDARDGKKIWEIDVPKATETAPPKQFWGFASSPYVVDGLVIVFTNGGLTGKGTAAFKVSDGSLVWAAGIGTHGYCTAQRVTLAGVDQLLMASDKGLESFEIATGKIFWTHKWPTPANRSNQPMMLGNDELLLSTGYGVGTRRLKVTKAGEEWTISQVGSDSRHLKPYYNDAVLHQGLVYGFDDKAFVCYDPATGRRTWSAGTRYGFGQVLLLADQNLLIVMAENGTVALVETNGQDFVEKTSFKALNKKTWNHPVINRGRLYVRNAEEMACFEL